MNYDRSGLIVWLQSLKHVKSLKSYGNIHYVSEKMQYVVLYCDAARLEDIIHQLRAMPFVQSVQKSLRASLITEFDTEGQSHA